MTTAPLEDRRENFMHRLDEVGLGLIGAGVAGAMLKHKFGPKLNASWAAENLGTLGKHIDPHAAMDMLHSLPAEAVVRNTGWRGALGRAGEGLAAHGHAMDLVGLGLITPTAMGYIANKVHPDAPAGELPKVAFAPEPRDPPPGALTFAPKRRGPPAGALTFAPTRRRKGPMEALFGDITMKAARDAGIQDALSKLGLDQKSKGGYSKKETRELYPEARGHALEERHEGLNEELEHRDITRGNDARTKKIVDAHLEERPDYYSRLSRAMR